MTTQHLIILGLALAAATPAIIAFLKVKVVNNPALSAVMPFALTAITWVGDALISGVNPFGEAGLSMLIAALSGSLVGAKGRDVWKYGIRNPLVVDFLKGK